MNRTYEDINYAEPYGRLSDEDRDKRNFSMESDSIASQRRYINQFCEERGIKHDEEGFFDDGITGQTFERRYWNELLRKIEMGLVDCVITKDLSRLGRDHSETGYYIEKYFPEHKVRYISINDNWDSKYDSIDLLLWKLAYNDVYCADISRKVKSILNSKKRDGQYVGSFAPYGYMKDPEDKHRLIPDPQTAPIVKEIFSLADQGTGTCGIATIMNEKKYPTPGVSCGRKVSSKYLTKEISKNVWVSGMVRRILTNIVYVGDLAQCKIRKASYKSKKLVKNNEEDWIVVQNTHEPLTERDVFERINKNLRITSKKYNRLPGEKDLLSKLIYCKDCGHRISISWKDSKNHDKGKSGYCNYYKKYSKYNVCTPHFVDYAELEEQVLSYVRVVCQKMLEYLDSPRLIQDNYRDIRNRISEIETRLNKTIKELDKAEGLLLKMYEEKLEGKITESMYETLAIKKETEINDLKETKFSLSKDIDKLSSQLEMDKVKMGNIKKIINDFLNSKNVTQDLVNNIIRRIDVSEDDIIDLYFAFPEMDNIKI